MLKDNLHPHVLRGYISALPNKMHPWFYHDLKQTRKSPLGIMIILMRDFTLQAAVV